MIWRRTATNHLSSIGGFARTWLGWGIFDRLIPITLLGWFWCAACLFLGLMTRSPGMIIFLMVVVAPIPWGLLAFDALADGKQVSDDIEQFAREGAILATRCEYLGGHPQLPHGRFAYLLLEGSRQNPTLTLIFPTEQGSVGNDGKTKLAGERFNLPVLDVGKIKPERGSDDSPAADIATSINPSAGRLLRPERLNFVVNYNGDGSRQHKVELTNFFRGNNEIRNWQNYIVCAQAQADTGIEPHAPWIALADEPVHSNLLQTTKELEVQNAISGNGHEERKPSSAFTRR